VIACVRASPLSLTKYVKVKLTKDANAPKGSRVFGRYLIWVKNSPRKEDKSYVYIFTSGKKTHMPTCRCKVPLFESRRITYTY